MRRLTAIFLLISLGWAVLGQIGPTLTLVSECDPDGSTISTAAGGGPNNIPALSAGVSSPFSVAIDSSGNLYIAFPQLQHRIFKVDSAGQLTVVAGIGIPGFSGDGGPATSARLADPSGVALDASGNLYIADSFNNRIRKVNTSGTISTVAGDGNFGFGGDGAGATGAQLSDPVGVAFDASGNLYIADTENNRIRKVNSSGTISTVAGDGNSGFGGDGGPATSAQLAFPAGVALDASGNLYIADTNNNRVRKVNTGGTVSTVVGDGNSGFGGDGGPATSAQLAFPAGVALDASGNFYIADAFNNRIRKVDSTGIITTVAGDGTPGFGGDGGPATCALLALGTGPAGVALDASGNLYIADTFNSRIRKVDTSGTISTVAGNGNDGFSGDGGPATSAQLFEPFGVAVDANGNLYISDEENNRIRKVNTSGIITTVAGDGGFGFGGDGGPATCALLAVPAGVAVDAGGNLYIADAGNDRIRRVVLGGTGSAPVVKLSASSLSFGTKLLGTTSSPKTLTLSNPGQSALDITSITVSGDFAQTNSCGTSLAGGASCSITVTFTPTAAGSETGTLTLTDNASNSPQRVSLRGTGTAVSLSAKSLSFPTRAIGTTSPAKTVTLTNKGSGALSISGISIVGANSSDFAQSNTCGTSLAGGASCGISVSFSPKGAGARTASLRFSDSDPTSPQTVSLSGTGTAVSLSPTSLSFAARAVGTTSAAKVVTLTNKGSSALSITGISITGTNSGDFTKSSTCGTSLAGGASCTLSGRFSPKAVGARSASLRLSDSDSTSPQTVGLSGTGQ
jgi:sugar lactone lactonase YvrE